MKFKTGDIVRLNTNVKRLTGKIIGLAPSAFSNVIVYEVIFFNHHCDFRPSGAWHIHEPDLRPASPLEQLAALA